ncbi:MAG: hypothetical protein RLZZ617_853 [Bacteroidota bacterium]|jgi:uncharacterized FAD-dependent dehydrogenase
MQFWAKMSVHEIYLNPAEAYAPQTLGYPNLQALMEDRYAQEISGGLTILRRSIDARGSGARVLVRFAASSSKEAMKVQGLPFVPQILGPNAPELHIVGAGPAGIFAALRCLEYGWRPIIVERGQAIRERRRDVALLSREGQLNADSNYCFGEGGAGTFSDGKLYTRSTKRGDIDTVLRLLIELGAPPEIAYEAHPHIGTNKLPALIQTARQWIEAAGGYFQFGSRVEGLDYNKSVVKALVLQDGRRMPLDYLMLCTGHSARDVYEMLDRCGLSLEPKALAMGVRLEHPQEIVNKWRYRLRGETPKHWPVASYAVVEQVAGKGVYSFCMCPGGIMAPCATNPSEVVTNGWSPSRRNNGTANSGWVTEIGLNDVPLDKARPAFSLLNFQQNIESRAAEMGGGHQWAPAQSLQDFATPSGTKSKAVDAQGLSACSYRPGVTPSPLNALYPVEIQSRLAAGLHQWAKRWPALMSPDAVVAGPESRTSSPIRIPRLDTLLHHPQCANLFPVGEGAGYAGGIMSAILDARRSVDALIQQATHAGSSIR